MFFICLAGLVGLIGLIHECLDRMVCGPSCLHRTADGYCAWHHSGFYGGF